MALRSIRVNAVSAPTLADKAPDSDPMDKPAMCLEGPAIYEGHQTESCRGARRPREQPLAPVATTPHAPSAARERVVCAATLHATRVIVTDLQNSAMVKIQLEDGHVMDLFSSDFASCRHASSGCTEDIDSGLAYVQIPDVSSQARFRLCV